MARQPPQVTIRPVTAEEFPAFARAEHLAFGGGVTDQQIERARSVTELARTLAAFDGDRIVATAAMESMRLSVPGGIAPMGGCTDVTVSSTHRRRGVLRSLMRRQLDDVHDSGEALAGLWASESVIYGRYGYGAATRYTKLRVSRSHAALRPDVAVADEPLTLVEADEAIATFRRIYETAAAQRAGMICKPEPFWRNWLGHDEAGDRDGASPRFHLRLGDRGFAVYRIHPGTGAWLPDGETQVFALVATDGEAEAALWRHCLDMDLTDRMVAHNRGPDELLPLLLADSRRVETMAANDALWLRMVRLGEALSSRRYDVADTLVLDVRDEFCPWNAGRWRLDGGLDGASCARTDTAADLGVDVAGLASAFLGDVPFRRLARGGLAAEHTPGALARADRMFATAPLPWCPFEF